MSGFGARILAGAVQSALFTGSVLCSFGIGGQGNKTAKL